MHFSQSQAAQVTRQQAERITPLHNTVLKQANANNKKAIIATPVSDKAEFGLKNTE